MNIEIYTYIFIYIFTLDHRANYLNYIINLIRIININNFKNFTLNNSLEIIFNNIIKINKFLFDTDTLTPYPKIP